MRNWRYDERGGMVAVYEGDERNCLDLPASAFIFARYWLHADDGTWQQVEEDKRIARLIAAAPELLEALKTLALEASYYTRTDTGERINGLTEALEAAGATIAKAEGHV